ncbi:MAG: LPS ABC transporter substrate-binding protein LptA [Pseudolabrys sp.]|nr:LPS ABC transporter substrate-binding protein LptA [Pseudolabrys sp.]
MKLFVRSIVALGVLALLCDGSLAQAQSKNQQDGKGPPNALQGFSQNRDEPVNIESNTLEVRDKDKIATFSGDVRVKQGDTAMRSQKLVVFYEQEGQGGQNGAAKGASGKPMQAATPGPNGSQKIKRLEARGDVVVTQKDQTATGETGIFDMPTNTVTLTGNVVMTQGKNVLRGDKLIVDLTSGVSRVESGKNGRGRVQGLFLPSGGGPEAPAAAPQNAPQSAPPRGPLQLGPRN